MMVAKKLHKTFLVYLVFVLTCARMFAARIWPFAKHDSDMSMRTAVSPDIRPALLVRVQNPATVRKGHRQYALEVTGTFPYIRVVTLARRAVVMPAETAALSEEMAAPFSLQVMIAPWDAQQSAALQTDALTEFLRNCTSCSSCHSCTSCASCTCGCSSCSTCVSCGSCSTCGDCTSCGPCTSCTSCTGCGGCTSCAGCTSCSSCFGCSSCFCASVLVC